MRFILYTTISLLMLTAIGCSPAKKIKKTKAAADAFYAKGEKHKAALIYAELLKQHPKIENYGTYYINTADMFAEVNKTEEAIYWYEKVLADRTLRDNERRSSLGVLETHANYKHIAVVRLAQLHTKNRKYEKALKCYAAAQKTYPYLNHSKISRRERAIYIAYGIADCYLRMDQAKFATTALLPYALTLVPSSQYQPTKDLLKILKNYNLGANFKEEFDTALGNLEVRSYGVNLTMYAKDVKVERFRDELLTEAAIKKTLFYRKILED